MLTHSLLERVREHVWVGGWVGAFTHPPTHPQATHFNKHWSPHPRTDAVIHSCLTLTPSTHLVSVSKACMHLSPGSRPDAAPRANAASSRTLHTRNQAVQRTQCVDLAFDKVAVGCPHLTRATQSQYVNHRRIARPCAHNLDNMRTGMPAKHARPDLFVVAHGQSSTTQCSNPQQSSQVHTEPKKSCLCIR
jgi:hypothetical protein